MPIRARVLEGIKRLWVPVVVVVVLGVGVYAGVYGLVSAWPIAGVEPGEVGVRLNRMTGAVTEFSEGGVLVIPGMHRLRRFSLRDQVYQPTRSARARGEAPLQSVEGLSLGVDLIIRYAFDPSRVTSAALRFPEDVNRELVEPLVQGVIYRIFAQHTVREIFSTQRQQIQQDIEAALKPLFAAEGLLLRAVYMGNVDLPAEYRTNIEQLLAEELKTEKMRFTLELKEKEVKQTELEAEAQKLKREKAAEAAGNEEIIRAKAQGEAMQHVLPFKQKQIEQRKLEGEAERVARLKGAEATAEARRIEAAGEADARRKLAEAEAYRIEAIGRAQTEQLAREGPVLTQNPLLIQKTIADKLSDKITVIIAPPPESGGFIAAGLTGIGGQGAERATKAAYPAAGASTAAEPGEFRR